MHLRNCHALLCLGLLFTIAGCQSDEPDTPPPTETPAATQAADLQALMKQLASADEAEQVAAAAELAALGEDAAPAIEKLSTLLTDDDPKVRAHVARALGQIGPTANSAAEPLAKLLADPHSFVRLEAVRALARIEPGPDNVVPLMLKAFDNDDPDVVALAAHSLAQAGPQVVAPMLTAMEDERTIYWALLVLQELGSDAKQAVPAVAKALQHEDAEVRHEAAQTLRAIGPDAADAVAALAESLADEQSDVRMAAALALGSIGPAANPALDKLAALKTGDDALLTVCATWAIESIDANQERLVDETIPALIQHMASDNPLVRQAAALAITDLNPDRQAIKTLEDLASVLPMDDLQMRRELVRLAVDTMGADAVPWLIEELKAGRNLRETIVLLGDFENEAAAAVPLLIESAADENPNIRAGVFMALGRIGPDAKAATATAVAALDDEHEDVRTAALYTISMIGPAAVAAKERLSQLVAAAAGREKLAAAIALGRIAADDPAALDEVLPQLIAALESESIETQLAAAGGLWQLGPRARPALDALKKAATSEDADLRALIQVAIEEIEAEP